MDKLITGLGKNLFSTTYTLDGLLTSTARHSSLALLDLLPPEERPREVLVLLTQGARSTSWEAFSAAIEGHGLVATPVDIPDGQTPEEVAEIFTTAAEAVGDREDIGLDVTAGLRHTPFLLYALALHLQTIRGVTVAGAWYGMFEAEGSVKPIVPLGPLLQLPEWLWAGRLFVETGSTRALEQVIAAEDGLPEQNRKNLVAHLRSVARAYDFGLPLELSHMAGKLASLKKDVRAASQANPYAGEVLQLVKSEARSLSGSPEKKEARFDEFEQERQRALLQSFYERGQYARFLAGLREWMVSRAVQGDGWLKRETRYPAERSLGRLVAWQQIPTLKARLAEDQQELAKAWRDIRDLRNAVQHQGMSKQDVLDALARELPAVKQHFDTWSRRPLPSLGVGGTGGHLLVAALGQSPGVLWSALEHTRPHQLVVVCSPSTRASLDEVLERVEHDLQEVICWEVAQPFSGFEEVTAKLGTLGDREPGEGEQALWDALADADRVSLCLTGGTTLMGFAVQLVYEAAGRLGVGARRFALIDERRPELQRAEPYVLGDLVWVDPSEGE